MNGVGGLPIIKAGIFGIGSALPEQLITNAHFESRLATTDEWIVYPWDPDLPLP